MAKSAESPKSNSPERKTLSAAQSRMAIARALRVYDGDFLRADFSARFARRLISRAAFVAQAAGRAGRAPSGQTLDNFLAGRDIKSENAAFFYRGIAALPQFFDGGDVLAADAAQIARLLDGGAARDFLAAAPIADGGLSLARFAREYVDGGGAAAVYNTLARLRARGDVRLGGLCRLMRAAFRLYRDRRQAPPDCKICRALLALRLSDPATINPG